MLHIGCHLSSSKGYRHMGEEALSIKADTFQFFTRNPRGSKAKKANPKDAEALRGLMEEHAFAPVLGHAPYTLNACALDEGLRAFARDAMREDVMTLDTYLPHMLYNFHPGSHVGQGDSMWAWGSSSNCWTRSCVRNRPPASCWKPCPARGPRSGAVRGAGAYPPLRAAGRQDGRMPRHLPRVFGGI